MSSRFSHIRECEETLSSTESWVETDPSYYISYVNKILNLRKLRLYNEAKQTAYDALELLPNNVAILVEKGFLLYSLKEYKKAIDVFDLILELTGGLDQISLYFKGRCLELDNNLENAINVYGACYELDPTSQKGREALWMKSTLKADLKC